MRCCQLLGALGIVDSAVSGGTLDDKSLVVLGEVTDDLRSLDEVALHEGDGGRAGENLVETLNARFLGGDACQRVLCHGVGSIAA